MDDRDRKTGAGAIVTQGHGQEGPEGLVDGLDASASGAGDAPPAVPSDNTVDAPPGEDQGTHGAVAQDRRPGGA